jgi:regulator of cell morphogenesis and NO signaling
VAELSALLSLAAQPETKRKQIMTIAATKTVRELAVEIPNAGRVFEKLGVDYCCGGHRPLEEACGTANVALDQVLLALGQASGVADSGSAPDWNTAPLGEPVDHIVNKHHTYVKDEMPRLQALLAKVIAVHGMNHPELEQVQAAFSALANELATHMMKEEHILFPYLKQMACGGEHARSRFGTVQNPIRMMMSEHDRGGR